MYSKPSQNSGPWRLFWTIYDKGQGQPGWWYLRYLSSSLWWLNFGLECLSYSYPNWSAINFSLVAFKWIHLAPLSCEYDANWIAKFYALSPSYGCTSPELTLIEPFDHKHRSTITPKHKHHCVVSWAVQVVYRSVLWNDLLSNIFIY